MDWLRNRFKAVRRPFGIWTSLTHVGDFMLRMVDIWLGLISMPCWVIRYPKNFLKATPKVHFSDWAGPCTSKGNRMRRSSVASGRHTGDSSQACHRRTLPWYVRYAPWRVVDHPLEICSSVLQSEGHHLVAVDPLIGDERCLVFIWWMHLDLIVSWIGVHETE